MTNKKEYVSPEVNVILVGEDIMNGSNGPLPNELPKGGVELPELEI